MNIFLKYIGCIFLMVACTSNTILKKPKDLIPKKKMVALLTDLYLAKAMQENENPYSNIDEKNKKNTETYQWILKKYRIDTGSFQRSNYYYCSVIDAYQKIYQKVAENLKDTLQKIEASIDSIKIKQPTKTK